MQSIYSVDGGSQRVHPNAEYCRGYSEDVDVIREREYPLLKGVHRASVSLLSI